MEITPIWLSIKVSLLATAVVFILGALLAILIQRSSFKGKTLIESAILLPLVLPPTVAGFLLLVLIGRYGPVGQMLGRFGVQLIFSWHAAVIASAAVSLPLMYQAVKAALEAVDPDLEDAARTLGAGELKVLGTITLPLAWPGLVSGAVMAFTRSLGEFGATLMIAGNIPGQTQTIPLAIYSVSQSGDMAGAGTLVLILVSISFSLVFGVNTWRKRAVRWR